MRTFSEEHWQKLPIEDYRGRFFIESFLELLHRETPHFFQARLMDIISASAEAIESIELYLKNEKYISVLKNSLKEIQSCIDLDPISSDYYSEEDNLLNPLIKSITGSNSKIESQALNKVRLLCFHIEGKKDGYYSKVVNSLYEKLANPEYLAKKESVLSDIYKITSIYITNLLNRGYSPTYLYNKCEMFTRANNYKERSFIQQFESITSSLDSRIRKYKVYFAVRTKKKSTLLRNEHLSGLEFIDALPENLIKDARNTYSENTKHIYAVTEVEAPDYISASWMAKERLDCSLDYIITTTNLVKLNIDAHCLSIFKAGGKTFKQKTNIDLLVKLLTHDSSLTNLGDVDHQEIKKQLSHASSEHLSQSLRYLRIGRESISLEQKLLNTWIALESLFYDSDHSSIIQGITSFVPKSYANESLTTRSSYLLRLLIINKIPIPEKIKEKYDLVENHFEKSIPQELFFEIITHDDYSKAVFDSVENSEHLKFRIKSVHDELRNKKTIRARLTKTENDVSRQLQRLYLFRNKIAHTGYNSGIRPQLINHLTDYLFVCYRAIFTSFCSTNPLRDINILDSLLAYQLGLDQVTEKIKAGDGSVGLSVLRPTPML